MCSNVDTLLTILIKTGLSVLIFFGIANIIIAIIGLAWLWRKGYLKRILKDLNELEKKEYFGKNRS